MDITFNYKNLSPFIKKYKINNKLILINYFNKKDNYELIYEITDPKYNIIDAKVKNIKIYINNKEINANYFNLGNTKEVKLILDKNEKEYMIEYVRLYTNKIEIKINNFFSKIYVITYKNNENNIKILNKIFENFNLKIDYIEKIENNNKLINENNHENKLNNEDISYLKTWELILEKSINENYKNILIFDENIILNKNFNILLMELLYYVNEYKILNLGNNNEINNNENNLKYFNCNDYTNGKFAIALNNSIFTELNNLIKKYNSPLDEGCLQYIYKKYPNDCYYSDPNLVIYNNIDEILKTTIKSNYIWLPYFNKKIVLFYIIDTYNKIEESKVFIQNFNNSTYELYLINILDINFNFKNLNNNESNKTNYLKIININEIFRYIKDSVYFSFINITDKNFFDKILEKTINNEYLIYLSRNENLNFKINNILISLNNSIFETQNFINFFLNYKEANNNILELFKKYILEINQTKEFEFNLLKKNKKIFIDNN
jgi:hypothetical protein